MQVVSKFIQNIYKVFIILKSLQNNPLLHSAWTQTLSRAKDIFDSFDDLINTPADTSHQCHFLSDHWDYHEVYSKDQSRQNEGSGLTNYFDLQQQLHHSRHAKQEQVHAPDPQEGF